jgi:hypothetical protein
MSSKRSIVAGRTTIGSACAEGAALTAMAGSVWRKRRPLGHDAEIVEGIRTPAVTPVGGGTSR